MGNLLFEVKNQENEEIEMKNKEDEEQALLFTQNNEEKGKVVESHEGEPEKIDTIVVMNLDTNMVTMPLEECTPSTSIPNILSLTSPGLGIECAVVAVGDYYYSHKIESIEKRSSKRKRGGASQDTKEISVIWKEDPDPKENSIQTTSILSSFVGTNSMSFYEMDETLDMSKSRQKN
jgi:hypothetical protein